MKLRDLYKDSLSLLTDFYQLTMAASYWKEGLKDSEAVYHLHFRKNPFKGGFAIAAGLDSVIEFLKDFHFDSSDLDYLSGIKDFDGNRYFDDGFLKYLSEMQFTCDVDAVPEGTVVFPQESLVRVKGPIIQCQILESPLLNLVNFPTLVATKGARVAMAAGKDTVMEFGLRRAQGIDGAITASRSSYIGGCHSTSNVLAGKMYGIPVSGTHAHSWIMAFDEEIESFYAFARAMPGNTIFLVDTYDTIEGIRNAVEVGKWLKENGRNFYGIRLDSGDLAYLSMQARKMLDEAGFESTKVVGSNELDETVISDLKKQGAKIGVWGVGTNLAAAKDQPALDGVYKLSAIKHKGRDWQHKLKLSEQMIKISNPGILQVRRFSGEYGNIADIIYDELLGIPQQWTVVDPLDPTRQKTMPENSKGEDLLEPIFRKGKLCCRQPSIHEIRENTLSNLKQFHPAIKRFLNPHQYVVGLEKNLYRLKVDIINDIREKAGQ